MERIEADLMIPGRGDPIRNACVVLDGPAIAYAGPMEGAPKAPAGARVTRVPVVMPGLWDCHGHLMGIRSTNVEDVAKTSLPVLAARAVADARTALLAGFTSVRDLVGLGVHLSRIVAEGTIPGPHIYGGGAMLSPTAGHGDLHMFPTSYIHALGSEGYYFQLCDGVAECLRGVRNQLRLGARVIKVCASGGVMSEVDHPMHQQFSDDELRAIVGEAGRAERIVAAHCHGKPGIMAALRAGCGTIEHGSYLDEEAADAMIERGAILVPTRYILERLITHGPKMNIPDYAYRKVVALGDDHKRSLRLAIRKGVRIALGTDIWSSGSGTIAPWGQNARELVHLVEAGLTPLQAIEAATANGPLSLGPQAPKSGQLLAGYDADVLGVRTDPLSDVSVLAAPENLMAVWKSGQRVDRPSS
ncbi:MAG TPA: amidohydrolase family protein [Thermoplasmata archaeon]|jgi:imidazolonepropionase-like amidohydrolase|nr:amidohydrolase family protein [Thermoplasmata archaeon]